MLSEGSIIDNSEFFGAIPPGGKPRKIWFLELLKISRESKLFVVKAGWGERGKEVEKFLSSLARQRNIAQLLSFSKNNKNVIFFLILHWCPL